MLRLTAITIAILLLAGCAKDLTIFESAERDYQKAKHMVEIEDFGGANLFLQNYSVHYPYSRFAPEAELLRIYAAYKNREYVLSETLSDMFIKRHPTHKDITYAKYMLAMSHLKQTSDKDRDQSSTKKAIATFEELIKEFPESEYAADAKPKLQELYNKLASHELSVGKFYFDRERYVAAANRFQVVLEKYQTTPAIEEALYYLAASYARLGIADSSREIVTLLNHNYPESRWSSKAKSLL